ncbi:MAG: 50S ribosomal protein L11 methyltransferase [Myxococcales bacterium]|nr:50S ribosomal protein L11 methyltransferase [Myxococcales bacterium]
MSTRASLLLLLVVSAACSRAAPPSDSAVSASASAPEAGAAGHATAASASAAPSAPSAAPSDAGSDARVGLDIIYVPTPQKVVDKMLEVAKVTKDDVVYDLGCGDGRIVVSAAKKIGARGLGFDLDPQRVKEANANVEAAKVGALVSIKQENVFSVDLSPATVVTLYLLPEINVKLIPQLEKMRPGSRIVSHDFDMQGAIPDGHWTVTAPEFVNGEGYSAWKGAKVPEDKKNYRERRHEIYLWTIPLKKAQPADAGAAKP